MASGDDGDLIFFGIAEGGEGDRARGLVMDQIGLKLTEDLFDFRIRIDAGVETVFIGDAGDFFAENSFHFGDFVDLVGVKRVSEAGKAGDFEVVFRIFLYMKITGGAGGKYDDLVAARCKAGGKIARKNCYAVDHGVVEVGGNSDLHARIIICQCREKHTMFG